MMTNTCIRGYMLPPMSQACGVVLTPTWCTCTAAASTPSVAIINLLFFRSTSASLSCQGDKGTILLMFGEEW